MQLTGILSNAKKKMEKTLDDFNKAIPMMKSLGLSVTDLHVKMALLPAILATLEGSFQGMDPLKIKHLKEGNPGNKVLGSILRALETAANVKRLIAGIPVEGIRLRVKLSVFPDIDVGFIIPKSEAMPSEAQAVPSEAQAVLAEG